MMLFSSLYMRSFRVRSPAEPVLLDIKTLLSEIEIQVSFQFFKFLSQSFSELFKISLQKRCHKILHFEQSNKHSRVQNGLCAGFLEPLKLAYSLNTKMKIGCNENFVLVEE